MNPTRSLMRHRQTGFTLIELMVGMAIGMIATIIIVQVMSVFEAQKRTTTGSADAQTNGGIALYSIAREVQMGGFPLLPIADSALECTSVAFGSTGITGTNVTGLAPVIVTEGVSSSGVSASDTITIRYGSSLMGGAVSQITAMSGSVATVGSSLGCTAGDITLINTGAVCNMSKVAAAPALTTTTVPLVDIAGAASTANLACLGTWNQVTYAVNTATGNLDRTVVVNGVSSTAPSVVGVVNLQVQYGISASSTSNQITRWVNAKNIGDLGGAGIDGVSTGADWGSSMTVPNRNRIKAIRIAVVARNAKIEPTAVSSACNSLTSATPTGLCAWAGSTTNPAPSVDLSQGDANWAKYRYRVFETIIPLRNVIWSKDVL